MSTASIALSLALTCHGGAAQVANTGSMKPTLDEHNIIVWCPVDWSEVKVGDIVVIEDQGHMVAHRVKERGKKYLVTKGDANAKEDVFLTHPDTLKGRVEHIL